MSASDAIIVLNLCFLSLLQSPCTYFVLCMIVAVSVCMVIIIIFILYIIVLFTIYSLCAHSFSGNIQFDSFSGCH